ncbi:hypothetical protein C8J56DRAFT_1070531 [Mycena floridula]|nr:hypothetical protein C8J56DRAFT_1070531 [Mycena floridula]
MTMSSSSGRISSERLINQRILTSDAALLAAEALSGGPLYSHRISTGTVNNIIETGWVDDGYGGQRYVEHGRIEEEVEPNNFSLQPTAPRFISDDSAALPACSTPPPGPRLRTVDLCTHYNLRLQEQAIVDQVALATNQIQRLPRLISKALSDVAERFRHCMAFIPHEVWNSAPDDWNKDYQSRISSLESTLKRLGVVINCIAANPISDKVLSKLKEHYNKLVDLLDKFNRAFKGLSDTYDGRAIKL